VRRRTLLAAGGATAGVTVLGLAGCADITPAVTSGPPEKVTYLTGFNLTGQDAPVFVAIEKGYFRDRRLEVAVKAGFGTGQNLKLLRSGQADFAVLDVTGALLEYGAAGHRGFRMVAAYYQRSVSCIMALQSRGITQPRDLEGRRVGYTAGGVNKTLFPTYAKLAGVNDRAIRWTNLPPAQLRPNLLAGQLDAVTEIVIGRPAVEAAAGQPVSVLPYSDHLRDLYGNALATSLTTAMGNPRIVRRFRDAVLQGLAYAIDHPDEAGQIVTQHVKTYQATAAAAEVRAMAPFVRSGVGIGHIDEARVVQSVALLQAAGAIPEAIPPNEVVSLELVP